MANINFINFINLLHELLQKPIEYCTVQLQSGQILTFGGSHQPCAYVQLSSIGRLGPIVNLSHSQRIMTELENTLGIYPHLAYINFLLMHLQLPVKNRKLYIFALPNLTKNQTILATLIRNLFKYNHYKCCQHFIYI